MVGIAQLVSAPDCGSGGPGFESLYPPSEQSVLDGLNEECVWQFYDGLSPSGKALDFDSSIRRFESC